jgi:hypothetical protein
MSDFQGAFSKKVVQGIYEDSTDEWLKREYTIYEDLYEIESFEDVMIFEYLEDCRQLLLEEIAKRFSRLEISSKIVYLKSSN